MPLDGMPTIASPGSIAAPGHDRVQVDQAHAEADQVEAVRRRVALDQVGQDGQLSARDLELACSAPSFSPIPICSSISGSACSTAM